jgi:hypothetical protein
VPTAPLVDRLPNDFLILVGEVVTAWSMQEHELKLIVFLLLSLDPKRGRLAVKSTRAKDTVDLIADLLHLEGIESKTTDLTRFAAVLNEMETRRNLLAHNVWLQVSDGRFFLQSLAGTWPAKDGKHRRKRRIDPAGIPMLPENLEDLVNGLRNTISQTRTLRLEIATSLSAKGVRPAPPHEPESD